MFVYMLVDKITGVGQAEHNGSWDWILLDQCRFGFKRVESPGAEGKEEPTGTTRAIAKAVVLTRRTDLATTSLTSWLTSADARNVAIEYCLRPNDVYMMRLDLTKAQLRTYQADYQKDAETVTESLQLDYEDILLDYWEQGQTNQDKRFVGAEFELKAGN